jgi:ABC-type transport system involved in multi-copper enzyme maturation permease subunit
VSATVAVDSPQLSAKAGFPQLLHAEWTKLRTVRSWLATLVIAALVMVGFSWLAANGSHESVCDGGTNTCHGAPPLAVGPGGEAVADTYYFVHQQLTGDGSITARVVSLTGVVSTAGNAVRVGTNPFDLHKPYLAPWAKAGLLLTPKLTQGSAYAAVMATGSHGVRMQSNYTSDTAGAGGAVTAASPHWLRLTRAGDTITGADSTDGVSWTTITTAHLANLPPTVQVGMFVASPVSGGGVNSPGKSTYATGRFDHVELSTGNAGTPWTGAAVNQGPGYNTMAPGGYHQTAAGYTVSGSGDIAPAVNGAGSDGAPAQLGLIGAFAAMIAVAVLGALFIGAEYRRGLIRTTFTASPHRGRVLAAKSIVIAGATFVVALPAALVSTVVSRHVLTRNGNALYPLSGATETRVIVGTALLVALTAVIALAVATITRRGSSAVVVIIATTVLPLFLALTVPGSVGTWLLRLTPAAGFSLQQQLPRYAQVAAPYTPSDGYYPFGVWGGFAVLCFWVVVALLAARWLLQRRDA